MLKRFTNYLFSMWLMATLVIVYILSIAVATFIENDFGTTAAKALIYNSVWFEVIMLLLLINMIGNILRRKLYLRKTFTIFLFHIAFAFILLGAFITRYFGEEGYMRIREGKQTNQILTSEVYLDIELSAKNEVRRVSEPVLLSPVSKRSFSKKITHANKSIEIKSIDFYKNAIYSLVTDFNGVPIIELITPGASGRTSIFLKEGELDTIGRFSVCFNDTLTKADIHIYSENQSLFIKSKKDFHVTNKHSWQEGIKQANTKYTFQKRQLHRIDQTVFVLNDFQEKGIVSLTSNESEEENNGPDAVILEIKSGEKAEKMVLFGNSNSTGKPASIILNNTKITARYGAKVKEIPFSLYLEDFRLSRYPGSNSPSSFESSVVLIDPRKNIRESREIFMNNVLKHSGYKFYQSSYDNDEAGTILSVNKDAWGTLVTYFGYIMLALGMLTSLFNKNSRFQKLRKQIATISSILVFVVLPTNTFANDEDWQSKLDQNTPNAQHAEQFGALLIQDNQGRIKPINTLSSEVLRKVSRKNSIHDLNPDQVFLGMLSNPKYWQTVPLIKVSHDEIKRILGMSTDHISFREIVNGGQNNQYRLGDYIEDAYRKKPAYRSKFDNEMIRLDERVNICYAVFTNSILKILPVPYDESGKWNAPTEETPSSSSEESLFLKSIVPLYFQELNTSLETNEWLNTNQYLESIGLYQNKYGGEIIPSESKQQLEIFYNKAQLFDRISKYYLFVGFLLLIIQFVSILSRKPVPGIVNQLGQYLVLFIFLAHAFGLILRWYISGHAPWSNGYEALIYIAWATVLAGILFSKRSPITIPATALLANLILHVAHMSWMDPEITNLVPVLKSVWLVIHVAIITASYGFLALGALLALLNLFLMIFKTSKNISTVDQQIMQLSHILEITLIAGLYMLSIGTFLGGVWANESWGRYWGWDPKEAWALITIFVYVFIAHMRLIPGLKGSYALNLAALFGFSSVIMTYFGVNFYLAGLHSYAKGDPLPIPDFVLYTVIALVLVSLFAYINQRRFRTKEKRIL